MEKNIYYRIKVVGHRGYRYWKVVAVTETKVLKSLCSAFFQTVNWMATLYYMNRQTPTNIIRICDPTCLSSRELILWLAPDLTRAQVETQETWQQSCSQSRDKNSCQQSKLLVKAKAKAVKCPITNKHLRKTYIFCQFSTNKRNKTYRFITSL